MEKTSWGWGIALIAAMIFEFGPFGQSVARGAIGGCVSCHRPQEGFSHPIGVAPRKSISAALPLEGGVMVCTTCHEEGGDAHAQAISVGTAMLRTGINVRSLCGQCHDASTQSKADVHAMASGKAHLAWSDRTRRSTSYSLNVSRRGGGSFVQRGNNCIGCHDGLISTEGSVVMGSNPTPFLISMGPTDHPIQVDYSRAVSARAHNNGVAALRSAGQVDERIHFENGLVTCTSCHSVYSDEKKLLVMSNDHSRLCLSCHRD